MTQNRTQLGILGGGQLAMMLAQKAQALGLVPSILTPSAEDPASQVASSVSLGDPRNAQNLRAFLPKIDLLTFESEFYNAVYLQKNLQNFNVRIFPNLENLKLLQDRKTQKESFLKYKLPTSPFIHSAQKPEIQKFFQQHKALVAKKRWNGYDGNGTTLLKTQAELLKFLEENESYLADFIFEKFISFQEEIAVQAARSRAGHIIFFPFVKTIQKDNKCFLVVGPEKPDLKMQKKISRYLNKIGYVGVMGLEFFKTKTGLVLNETAPRVHNTGHHTWDSCSVDQFTMHLLCGLQDRLPKIHLKTKNFVMLNLIGQSTSPVSIPEQSKGNLYWYGKTNRRGRKLGHINFTGETKKSLLKQALQELKHWKL